jgi:hypothetical protein
MPGEGEKKEKLFPEESQKAGVQSDKNSLFDRGSIGEMGLCVRKNKSQYMGGLGYPVAWGIVRDARAGEAGPQAAPCSLSNTK